MTPAIAARIIGGLRKREKECYSNHPHNIKKFQDNHRKDVRAIAIVCHACRTVINVGDEVVSRLAHSAANRAVHYHLACAQEKNIV